MLSDRSSSAPAWLFSGRVTGVKNCDFSLFSGRVTGVKNCDFSLV